MFQVFDLIVTSPLGVFIFAKVQDFMYAAIVASECDECGFNDLGKLLFGGLAVALVAGVGVSILVYKWKAKQQEAPSVVSIHAHREETKNAG